MAFIDDLRKKLDNIGAFFNPPDSGPAPPPPTQHAAQFLFNAKAQAKLNQNQPIVNGHVFTYATPDINAGPQAPYSPLLKGLNLGNSRTNSNVSGAPLLKGITNAANPSLNIYSNNAAGGQQWYENDNAGTPGGGPYMHIPIIKPGTPQLDTQGPVAPNWTGNFMSASPQYINPTKKYPRIQI